MANSVMTLTDAAADRVRHLMSTRAEPAEGLRIGVRTGGCSGMAYEMAFAADKEPLDEVVEEKGVKLFVDTKALIVDKRHDDDEYGIVLLSDIAREVMARDKAPDRVNVYEIMSKPVVCVDPKMDIRYCARMFDRFGLSRAPVVEAGAGLLAGRLRPRSFSRYLFMKARN